MSSMRFFKSEEKSKESDKVGKDIDQFNSVTSQLSETAKQVSQTNLTSIVPLVSEKMTRKSELLNELRLIDGDINSAKLALNTAIKKREENQAVVNKFNAHISILTNKKKEVETVINKGTDVFNAIKEKHNQEMDQLTKEKDNLDGALAEVHSQGMKDAFAVIKKHDEEVAEAKKALDQLEVSGLVSALEKIKIEPTQKEEVKEAEAKPEAVEKKAPKSKSTLSEKTVKLLAGVTLGLAIIGGSIYVSRKAADWREHRVQQEIQKKQAEINSRLEQEKRKVAEEAKAKEQQEQQKIQTQINRTNTLLNQLKLTPFPKNDARNKVAEHVFGAISKMSDIQKANLGLLVQAMEDQLRIEGWNGNYAHGNAIENLKRRVDYVLNPDKFNFQATPSVKITVEPKVTKQKKVQKTVTQKVTAPKPTIVVLTDEQAKKVLKVSVVKEALKDFSKEHAFTVQGPKTSEEISDRERILKILKIKDQTKVYVFNVIGIAEFDKSAIKVPMKVVVQPTYVKVSKL